VGLAPWVCWQRWCEQQASQLLDRLREVYGEEGTRLGERLAALRALLARYREHYGEAEVAFVRAPGRLNTLSMHTDHRGSLINPMALEQEVLLCFSPSEDSRVDLANADPEYGSRSFHITQYRPPGELASSADWLHWTQLLTDRRRAEATANDWVHKAAAVPVYLQQLLFPARSLRGITGVLTTDLPPRIGLSSSSALVVAMMEALLAANGLEVPAADYAIHCGVAEWYVGTRGGFGDHAAIKFSRRGFIIHMKTQPELDIRSYIPFPEGHEILVFNSGLEADKTGPAGNTFNERTATYEIGEMYLRKLIQRDLPDVYRQVTARREHLPSDIKRFYLADIVDHFGREDIYRWLAELPRTRTRVELEAEFPEDVDLLRQFFATHREPPRGYPLRAVLTYGVAECWRGKALEEILARGDIATYGRLMTVSHDGDRVSHLTPQLRQLKANPPDPELPLELQPGDYACSIPEIDRMVDIALEAGALGAQISGAGLGGSMMALVARGRAQAVVQALTEGYFQPARIVPNYLVARPSQGACLL
jgi:galactokinase